MRASLGYTPDVPGLSAKVLEASRRYEAAQAESRRWQRAVDERSLYFQRASDEFDRMRRVAKARIQSGNFAAWSLSAEGQRYGLVAERYWEMKARLEEGLASLSKALAAESVAGRQLRDVEMALAIAQAAASRPSDAALEAIANAWENWVLGRSNRRPSAMRLWDALARARALSIQVPIAPAPPAVSPPPPRPLPVVPNVQEIIPTPGSSGMAPYGPRSLPGWALPSVLSPGGFWGNT